MAEDMTFLPKRDLLSLEELDRLFAATTSSLRAPPPPPPAIARPPAEPPQSDAPRTGRVVIFGLIVMFGFFGGFMAWAVFAPLSEAAIAPGMTVTC